MRKIFSLLVACVMTMLISCADYEEGIKVVNFDVKLEFPSTYDGSYEGLRQTLREWLISVFLQACIRSAAQQERKLWTTVTSSMVPSHR